MSDYTSNSSRPASPVAVSPDPLTARPQAYRFNWDAAARLQGPGSVSETTDARGGYFSSTPRVDIYGASSSSQLAAVPSQWSSAKHGFHGTLAVSFGT